MWPREEKKRKDPGIICIVNTKKIGNLNLPTNFSESVNPLGIIQYLRKKDLLEILQITVLFHSLIVYQKSLKKKQYTWELKTF